MPITNAVHRNGIQSGSTQSTQTIHKHRCNPNNAAKAPKKEVLKQTLALLSSNTQDNNNLFYITDGIAVEVSASQTRGGRKAGAQNYNNDYIQTLLHTVTP